MEIDFKRKPKTYVVINPVAGVSQAETVREKIQSALQARDIPFEVYETSGKEDLKQKIRSAIQNEVKFFIAAGGDGTVSGVVDGVAGTEIPLGIIPTGTWNVVARAMNIPFQVDDALALLFQEHRIQTIDAMEIDKRFFVISISAGLVARTIKNVKREEKRRFGKFADVWSSLRTMVQSRSYPFEVKIDGVLSKFRASELMVANSGHLLLKSLQLDPNIRMDDGKLNVCRIYANSITDYLKLAVSILRGDQEHNWNVLCVEALQEVEIDCREKLSVQGDGDVIGRLPITVRIHPKAVHIVTPVRSQM